VINKFSILFLYALTFLGLKPSFAQGRASRIYYSVGITKTLFDWNIAGNSLGQNPNILSELKWEDLKSLNQSFALYVPYKNLELAIHFSRSKIYSGQVSDADFAADDRQQVTAFYIYQAGNGLQQMLSPSLSYCLILDDESKNILYIGFLYKHYKDNYEMLNLDKTLSDDRFKDIKNKYRAVWKGGGFYVAYEYNFIKKLTLTGKAGLEKLRYIATADWNSREDFISQNSFSHSSKRGLGLWTEGLIEYAVTKKIRVNMAVNFRHRSIGKGTDILYKKDGTIKLSQLNGGQQFDMGIQVGLSYSFNLKK